MQQATYTRLYADDQGESHFQEIDVDLAPVDFAPPAAPLNIAALFPATRCGLLGAPPDWAGQVPHPSPRRQLFCNLRGSYEITASDGTTCTFPAGSLLLLEDTTGKGHSTRITSPEDVLLVTIALTTND